MYLDMGVLLNGFVSLSFKISLKAGQLAEYKKQYNRFPVYGRNEEKLKKTIGMGIKIFSQLFPVGWSGPNLKST